MNYTHYYIENTQIISDDILRMGFSEAFYITMVGACGGLIAIIFKSMRQSRCEDMSCCCGLITCKRKVETLQEMELEMAETKK